MFDSRKFVSEHRRRATALPLAPHPPPGLVGLFFSRFLVGGVLMHPVDKELRDLVKQRQQEIESADRWTTLAAQALGNADVYSARIDKLLEQRSQEQT